MGTEKGPSISTDFNHAAKPPAPSVTEKFNDTAKNISDKKEQEKTMPTPAPTLDYTIGGASEQSVHTQIFEQKRLALARSIQERRESSQRKERLKDRFNRAR
jgi:hypothetical protein